MKRIALVCLFLFASPTWAQYVRVSGNIYRYGSQYYTRSYYAAGSYYGGCCRSYPIYVYTPTTYTPPAKAKATATVNINIPPPAKTANWKESVIEWAKEQDDNAAYLAAINILRRTSPAAQYASSASSYGSITSTSGFAYQPNSIALSQVDAVYAQTDINRLLQGAQQLVDNAGASSAQALTQVNDIAAAEAARNNELMQARERRLAVTAFLQSYTPPKTVTATTQAQASRGPAVGPPPLGPNPPLQAGSVLTMAPQEVETAWAKSAQQDCAACHFGEKIKGGFNLNDIGKLDTAGVARVLAYINPANADAKRCPSGGPPLPVSTFQVWQRKLLKL